MEKENVLLKSFNFDKIHDNEMRKFECWGSVEVLDRHDEIIPAEEIYKIMDIWMDRGAPIQYMHTNRNVGKGLNWQRSEKNGKPGVLITGMIYKHYAEDDEIWQGIKDNEFEGLSIGGKSYLREQTEEGTYLKNLIGYEFSVVNRTGNQEATFTEVNMMAKAENIKKEDPVMDENSEQASEDQLSQLANAVVALTEKVAMLEEKIAGKPEEDEPVEEEKAEETEEEEPKSEEESEEKAEEEDEVEKEEESEKEDETEKEAEEEDEAKETEEVTKLKEEVSEVKKEMAELKKTAITKVIETERPAEVAKTDKYSEVRKALKKQSQDGKINFADLGNQIRG